MNKLLDDLKDARLRSETTPDEPGYTETMASSGSCVAQLHPASRSSVGSSTGPSHLGTRILSTRQIEAWRDPGYYISIAFGSPRKIQSWECPACEFLEKPKRLRTGGNGGDIPRYLIASLSDTHSLVAISGTDMKKMSSIACSVDLRLVPVSESDLPASLDKGILIHRGFKECFLRMRGSLKVKVLKEVEQGAKCITLAGYSLGAALAFLCGVWLRHFLSEDIDITIKGYGTPRVGNAAWAKYVETMPRINTWRLVNYKDVVCRIPPKSMGYRHPKNEVFILKDGITYQECQESECINCSGRFDNKRGWLKIIHRLRRHKEMEHFGPYAGVMLHPDLVCTSSSSRISMTPSTMSDVPSSLRTKKRSH